MTRREISQQGEGEGEEMTASATTTTTTKKEIKKWKDQTTDTLWEICPFCNAYVKDLSYRGHGISTAGLLGPSIHSHIAAEHGMKRVRKGNKQRWLRVSSSPYQAWAKREEESRLRAWGKDSIRRHD
jgi:hypothetical protein